MSKLGNADAKISLAPFKNEIGNHWDKIVNDVNSALGRLQGDIITKNGDWKVGTKGKLVSKDGNEWNLPLNAPMFSLVRFGIQLNAIANAGSNQERKYVMDVQATIPEICSAWYDANYRSADKPELIPA